MGFANSSLFQFPSVVAETDSPGRTYTALAWGFWSYGGNSAFCNGVAETLRYHCSSMGGVGRQAVGLFGRRIIADERDDWELVFPSPVVLDPCDGPDSLMSYSLLEYFDGDLNSTRIPNGPYAQYRVMWWSESGFHGVPGIECTNPDGNSLFRTTSSSSGLPSLVSDSEILGSEYDSIAGYILPIQIVFRADFMVPYSADNPTGTSDECPPIPGWPPPPPRPPRPGDDDPSPGLSDAAIGGIALGVVASLVIGVIVACVLVAFCSQDRRFCKMLKLDEKKNKINTTRVPKPMNIIPVKTEGGAGSDDVLQPLPDQPDVTDLLQPLQSDVTVQESDGVEVKEKTDVVG